MITPFRYTTAADRLDSIDFALGYYHDQVANNNPNLFPEKEGDLVVVTDDTSLVVGRVKRILPSSYKTIWEINNASHRYTRKAEVEWISPILDKESVIEATAAFCGSRTAKQVLSGSITGYVWQEDSQRHLESMIRFATEN